MKRDIGQSSKVVLRETYQVFDSAENSFYSNSFFVGCFEFLKPMAPKLPVDSQNAFDALTLILQIRNDWQRSMIKHYCP
jgi:hypothetical protein